MAGKSCMLRAWSIALAVLCLGADGGEGRANLLRNGGFESGARPWFALDNPNWGAFTIGSEPAAAGGTNHFARVVAEVADPPERTRVFGAVQSVSATSLPARLRFRMRVAGEVDLDHKIYAQAVVIALHSEVPADNRQMRYVLHGVDSPPYRRGPGSVPPTFAIVMVPPTSEKDGWRTYDLDVAADFRDHHEEIGPISEVRVLLEARYDDLPPSVEVNERLLEVHYDDVVLLPGVESDRESAITPQ